MGTTRRSWRCSTHVKIAVLRVCWLRDSGIYGDSTITPGTCSRLSTLHELAVGTGVDDHAAHLHRSSSMASKTRTLRSNSVASRVSHLPATVDRSRFFFCGRSSPTACFNKRMTDLLRLSPWARACASISRSRSFGIARTVICLIFRLVYDALCAYKPLEVRRTVKPESAWPLSLISAILIGPNRGSATARRGPTSHPLSSPARRFFHKIPSLPRRGERRCRRCRDRQPAYGDRSSQGRGAWDPAGARPYFPERCCRR